MVIITANGVAATDDSSLSETWNVQCICEGYYFFFFFFFFSSSSSSPLQRRVSFGLLNNQPPLGSHGEIVYSLQYPHHKPNLGGAKFLRVTTS
jgi:hypothetical protein